MRRAIAAAVALSCAAVSLAGAPLLAAHAAPATAETPAGGRSIYVDPAGDDAHLGTSPTDALRSVQRALAQAQPGDTVRLAAGRYVQDVATVRDGTAAAPITISGPRDAVIAGAGGARVVQVLHDYLHLEGFTIDGAVGDGTFRDKLLYVLGRDPREGVTGLVVNGMAVRNAGGECVRLRSFSHDNVIANNTITSCGRVDFPGGKWGGKGKNGEGIYIGTAPDQWADGKNPTADPDASNRNWVHDNVFDTRGNECVDIKEGASGNIVEHNTCTGQLDPESAGFDSRGDGNVFRFNTAQDNVGAGVRLGGHTVAGKVYGKGNDVYGNVLRANAGGGVRAQVSPQGLVCENVVTGAGPATSGSAGDALKPAAACPTTPTEPPGPTTTLPATSTTSTSTPSTTSTSTTSTTPTTVPGSSTTSTVPGGPDEPCRGPAMVGAGGASIEAESAHAAGRFVRFQDASRSGGAAMTVPGRGMRRDGATSLTFTVELAAAGRFTIWAEGYGPDASSDSFTIAIDGAKPTAVDLDGAWRWKKAATVPLSAGRHVIVVGDREDGASLDRIAVAPAALKTGPAPLPPAPEGPSPQCSPKP